MSLLNAKRVLVVVVLVIVSITSCRSVVTEDDIIRQSIEYMCQISVWGSTDSCSAPTIYWDAGTLDMRSVPYIVNCLSQLPRPEAGSDMEEHDWAYRVATLTYSLRFTVRTYLDGLVNKVCEEEEGSPYTGSHEDVAEVRERQLERFGYLLGIKEVDETKSKRIKDLMSNLANESVSVPPGDEASGDIFIGTYHVYSPHLSYFRNAEEFRKGRRFTAHPLIEEGGAAVPFLLKAIRKNERPLPLKEILLANAILRHQGPVEMFLAREPFLFPPSKTLQRQPPDFLVELERMRLINLLEACERFRASHGKK